MEYFEIFIRVKNCWVRNYLIIFGGGLVLIVNFEFFVDFFDVILLGDGENLLGYFIEVYKEVRGVEK